MSMCYYLEKKVPYVVFDLYIVIVSTIDTLVCAFGKWSY